MVAIDYAFSHGPYIASWNLPSFVRHCGYCGSSDCSRCHWDRDAGAGHAQCCGSWAGCNRFSCFSCGGSADRKVWARVSYLGRKLRGLIWWADNRRDPFLWSELEIYACEDCAPTSSHRGPIVGQSELFRNDGLGEHPRYQRCAVRWCHDLASEIRNVCLLHLPLNDVGALLASSRVIHPVNRPNNNK